MAEVVSGDMVCRATAYRVPTRSDAVVSFSRKFLKPHIVTSRKPVPPVPAFPLLNGLGYGKGHHGNSFHRFQVFGVGLGVGQAAIRPSVFPCNAKPFVPLFNWESLVDISLGLHLR